ncbi:AEC family transporter [Neomicrococcus lactis]
MFLEILLKILPLFLGILVGFICSYWNRFRNAEPAISAFVFFIALPCLLFFLTAEADLSHGIPGAVLASILVGTLVYWALIGLVFWLTNGRNLNIALSSSMGGAFGNVAYLGIPVVMGVLGPAGYIPAIIIQLVHNVIFMVGYPLIHGVMSPQGSGSKVRQFGRALRDSLLKNPIMWAVLLGFVVNFVGWPQDGPIMEFADLMSAAASPTALFAVGLGLRPSFQAIRGGQLKILPVGFATVAKLVILPAITFLALLTVGQSLFTMDGGKDWIFAILIMAGMPTAGTAFVLATAAKGDANLVAATILGTNIFAAVTLPLLATLALSQ